MDGFYRALRPGLRAALWLRTRAADGRAQTVVEYALIIAFIVLAAAGGLTLLGHGARQPFNRMAVTIPQ